MKWVFAALSPGLMWVSLFSQGQPGVNVDLGMIIDAFAPGDQVEMPVTLVTRNDPQVAKISLEVGYPAELISFVEATLGGGAEASQAEVKAELGGVSEELQVLLLEVSAPTVIPEGVLVNLTFELSEGITLNHEIPVENLKQTAESLDGQEIRARGLGGSISPIEPIPACFFYMH